LAYLRFLLEWYNLPWVLAAGVGLVIWFDGRRRRAAVLLLAAGVAGLTLNGALHDFRIGPIGRWFPLVAVLALGAGWVVARWASRLRERWVPPLTGVAFNPPDLEGREAVVLSARLVPGHVGRARYRDGAGVSNIVRVHLGRDGDTDLRFGSTVRLGNFDPDVRSYRIEPVGGCSSPELR